MISDTEMLEWMIFNSAWVNFDSDGEVVFEVDDEISGYDDE